MATEREGLAARNAELETQLAAMKKAKGHMEALLLASGDDDESDTVKTLVAQVVVPLCIPLSMSIQALPSLPLSNPIAAGGSSGRAPLYPPIQALSSLFLTPCPPVSRLAAQVAELTAAVEHEKAAGAEKDAALALQVARAAKLEHSNENVSQQVEEAVAAATAQMKVGAPGRQGTVQSVCADPRVPVDMLCAQAALRKAQAEMLGLASAKEHLEGEVRTCPIR